LKIVKLSTEEARIDWEYLIIDSISNNIFVRYSWLDKMILHPDISEQYVYIIYENNNPIVGVPISKPKYKGDYTDILYNCGAVNTETIEEIKYILKKDFGERFPKGSFLKFNSWFVESNKDRINFSICESKQTWDIRLPKTYDKYLSKFNGKKLYNLNRSLFKLLGLGAEIEINSSLDYLDDFYELHEKRWGNRWTTGQLRKFMDAIIMDKDNQVWLNRIVIDNCPIYTSICFECEDVLYSFLSGSDIPDKLKQYSPGIILNLAVIKEAIVKGLTEYDLMKGNAPYKRFLGAQKRDRYYLKKDSL
jgi:hypothetical protein